ncbi:MAG: exodeoxyribonuclease VII small subunit [Polaromonas sp.]|nr:exodeoxyribonuclease VII small subunit [Polaromonas sp.]
MAKAAASLPSASCPPPQTDAAGADYPFPSTYEAALNELETLLESLESGQLPLDALLASYQRGAKLLEFCRSRLEAVEGQIKVLDGNEFKPWRAK